MCINVMNLAICDNTEGAKSSWHGLVLISGSASLKSSECFQPVSVPQAASVSTEACASGAAHSSGDTQIPGGPSDQLPAPTDGPTVLASSVAPQASASSPLPPNTASPF